MKLTVIGFWGAYPEKNEATSCFLLEAENTKIILDCGSGAVSQLQNYVELKDIDAVILSHYHHDHVADMGVFTYSRVVDMNLNKTEQAIDIYAHREDELAFSKLAKPPYTNVLPYDSTSSVHVGPITISFQKTTHPVPCFAMKVTSTETDKTLVYTADTTFNETLIPFAMNSNLLIAETSFYADQSAESFGHMNSVDVANLAKQTKATSVLLSHLPHFGNHQQLVDEVSARFSGNVALAKTGYKIYL
ncbi:MBL fold metallo-hydrolase [Salipaludibacillus daqingensis]|uniref:MBL fold metallo-hydrolase n=1 Tax=Salipaludibacillus daqingensis TaxID=3041001 RepID=UPI002473A67D|nr:MBL fold metallo-hydrolase [Salipaludibacillus daqingensis]